MVRTTLLHDRRWRSSIRSAAIVATLASIVASPAGATTYSARVRWQPGDGASVGYRIYIRTSTGAYGVGRDVGTPVRAADGSMSTVWAGLDTTSGYAFAVTAYDSTGLESSRSNEIALPTVAPPPPPPPPPPVNPPPPVTDPPPVAQPFGNPTIGGRLLGIPSQAKRASRFVLDQTGSISRVWLYVSCPAPVTQMIRPVVYADQSGQPGALLATGPDVAATGPRPAAWLAMPLSAPIALPPGAYWLGVHGGDVGGCLYFVGNDPAGQAQNADLFANGPTNPFNPALPGSGPISIYAESDPAITTRTTPPAHWFGTTAAGTTAVSIAGDVKRVSAFQLAETGTVSRLWMHVANPSPSWQTLRGTVYADAAGAPGRLVEEGAEVAIPPGTAPAWVALPLDQPAGLNPGRYWLGAVGGPTAGAGVFFSDATPNGRAWARDPYFDGASDPFGPSIPSTGIISVYAEYQPGLAIGAPVVFSDDPGADPTAATDSAVDATVFTDGSDSPEAPVGEGM